MFFIGKYSFNKQWDIITLLLLILFFYNSIFLCGGGGINKADILYSQFDFYFRKNVT